jgi:hypothetical protein
MPADRMSRRRQTIRSVVAAGRGQLYDAAVPVAPDGETPGGWDGCHCDGTFFAGTDVASNGAATLLVIVSALAGLVVTHMRADAAIGGRPRTRRSSSRRRRDFVPRDIRALCAPADSELIVNRIVASHQPAC